jgi:hypothetical protein
VRGEKLLLSGEDAEIGRRPTQTANPRRNRLGYIGFDVHKKGISFCAKAQDGRILDEGKIVARRFEYMGQGRSRPWRSSGGDAIHGLDA